MYGDPLTTVPTSIKLFHLCANMKWAHLPNAGGLYDQSPQLLDEFSVIFTLINEKRAKDDAEQQRKARNSRSRK